ncbi:hypothetical protein Agabi119p4_8935 [Agaricus bisporus var. burnettii]|uniref:Uncharacterized protein n=1 Tax=Agaricus bisporus var. burnettii TaxID=192524 RepID=A0A8H7EXW7_AGABI|nr:hypothetical protein Agabi119p4_8935 [Agaricus bisporus var. burnettii]
MSTVIGSLKFERVHEDMAISSLISAGVSGFDQGTTYEGILGRGSEVIAPASWEFIRGVLWNDDPACDFFNDFNSSNGDFQAWAGRWWFNFRTPDTITYRSHHGDLQFLHAMASTVNEPPGETQRKIMLWLEVMYKLSVGDGIYETDRIDSTGLSEFFNNATTPRGSETLRGLLVGTTPQAWDTNIERRALGSCFHVIQDSYAVGHCQRGLINPNNMVDVEYTNYWHSSLWFPWKEKIYIKGFTKENPGRFSSIKVFHCFDGQDHDKHEYYDSIPNGEKLDPSDPTSFYCIVGANDALDACTTLATAWNSGWSWAEGGVSLKMKQTFELASDSTTSDTKVDEYLWGLKRS